MPKYDCGCINVIDPESGILHSIEKCEEHAEFLKNQNQESMAYFESLLAIKDGIPQNHRYLVEMANGFGSDLRWFSDRDGKKHVLEIGPGLGQYIPFFLANGCRYTGVEINQYAVRWIANTFYVPVFLMDGNTWLSDHPEKYPFDCIFAAHVVEHLKDAPGFLQNCARRCDRLYLIVPDDSDPVNPDHLWFFTEESLRAILKFVGFKGIRSTIKKVMDRENFIYCVAEKG